MKLLLITALAAVCGAAKLDRTYLPPASARTAGGSPGALQAPNAISQNAAPKGSYTNDFQGVVVDAALAGTRASGSEETGLGSPRNSYGSTASKVGEAAFRGAQAGFRFPTGFGSANSRFGVSQESESNFGEAREIPDHAQGFGASVSQGFGGDSRPERPQAAQERAASTLKFDSEVGSESFNYAFETDNGISAEETGTAVNGVQAQGGYSYTGDDGKVYTVTYTADEGGYQPRGDHLPTPPPIPEEILKSLEQNAKDEANGVIDDGLYDAQKYNSGSDYADSDSSNGKQNGRPSSNTGNTDAHASGTFINQNIQNKPFNPNNQGDDKSKQFTNGYGASSNRFGASNEYLPPFQQRRPTPSQQRPQIPGQQRPQTPSYTEHSDADSSSTFQQESVEASGDFQSNSQQNQASPNQAIPTYSQKNQGGSNSQSFESRPNQAYHKSQSSGLRPSSTQDNGFKQSTHHENQFNQNGNSLPSSQSNRHQFGSAANTGAQNGRPHFSAQTSVSFNSQKATPIPDTELTTPFETSAQNTASSFGFNAQPNRNGQSQFTTQGSQFQTSLAPAKPTIPSVAQSRPESANIRPFGGNSNSQSTLSTQATHQQQQFNQQSPFGSKRPQFSQNQFSQNSDNQFAPSTQTPQFAQQSTQEDSYYYNTPSQAFNIPQNQGSRFPSAPTNQFNKVTQKPFASQTNEDEENYPSTAFPSQNGQRQGSSRHPSFHSQSTPSDKQFQSSAIASATNGITQASASSFAAPTSAPSFNHQQSSQSRQQFQQSSFKSNRPSTPEPSKPSFSAPTTTAQSQSVRGQSSQFEKQNFESAQPLSEQPLQDVKQVALDDGNKPDAPVRNLQYNGELYEYNKPAETVPPPVDGFGQFGTKAPNSQKPAPSRPQFGQSATAQVTSGQFAPESTPFSQSTKGSQGNQFGSRSQFGQISASAQAASKPFAPKPTQFSQSTKAQSSQFGSRPQFGQSSASAQAISEPSAPERTQFSQSMKAQSNQFGSQPQFGEVQATSSFTSKPQFGQISQTSQGDQFGAQTQEQTDVDTKPARQQFRQQTEQHSNQRRPFAPSQGLSSAPETPKPFGQNGSNCCNGSSGQQTSFGGRPSQFNGASSFGSTFQSNSAFKPEQSSSVAGKGEVFGGPRASPSFDETGYHY